MKNFFNRIWTGLTLAGRIILGLIIIAVAILIVYAATSGDEDESTEDKNRPEIAQVYEPSIGTPLPADVPGLTENSGNVSGAVTSEPSSSTSTDAAAPAPQFIAPAAGVNDSEPIRYESDSFKFVTVLPPYSNVVEKADGVTFTSRTGALHFLVSVNAAGSETLASIESQLRNSSTASNISYITFANTKAIEFSAKGYGTGIAFIANGNIFYLFGNKANFASNFQLQ